jgi:hypothetical protein
MVDWTIFLSPKLPLFSTKFVNIIIFLQMYLFIFNNKLAVTKSDIVQSTKPCRWICWWVESGYGHLFKTLKLALNERINLTIQHKSK